MKDALHTIWAAAVVLGLVAITGALVFKALEPIDWSLTANLIVTNALTGAIVAESIHHINEDTLLGRAMCKLLSSLIWPLA